MAIQYFVDFFISEDVRLTAQYFRPALVSEVLPYVALPFIILVFIPIVLSLIFSKLSPEIQIVSPLHIQIIALAWFLVSLYNQQHYIDFQSFFLVTFYAIAAGLLQDPVAIELLGRTANKDDIICASFLAKIDLTYIRSILLTKKFREMLGLQKKFEETEDYGIIIRSDENLAYKTIISLTKKEDNETFIDIAFYEETKYALKKTDELDEYAIRQIDYLKRIFERQGKPEALFKEVPNTHAEKLQYLIIDELHGRIIRVQKVSHGGWIKIIGIATSIFSCVIGYWANWLSIEATLAILIPTVVYVLFEAPIGRKTQ